MKDVKRLYQILVVLLGITVKFTASREVLVSVNPKEVKAALTLKSSRTALGTMPLSQLSMQLAIVERTGQLNSSRVGKIGFGLDVEYINVKAE